MGYKFTQYAGGNNSGNVPSGGGIIDVTELPTENIDESALYRDNDGNLHHYWGAEWLQIDPAPITLNYGGNVTLYDFSSALAAYMANGTPVIWMDGYVACVVAGMDMATETAYFMNASTNQLVAVAVNEDETALTVNRISLGGGGSGVILATIDIENNIMAEGTLTEFDAVYPARLIIKSHMSFSYVSLDHDFCLTFKEIVISSEDGVTYKYTGTNGKFEAICIVKADGTYMLGASLTEEAGSSTLSVRFSELLKVTTSGSYTIDGKVMTLTGEVTQNYGAGNTFVQREWYVRSGKYGTLGKATKTENGWSCVYGDGNDDTGISGTVEIREDGTVVLTAEQDLADINSAYIESTVEHLTGNISAGYLTTTSDAEYTT